MPLSFLTATLAPFWQFFEAEGVEAYVVGGAIRNALLNRPLHDIDMASPMLPDELAARWEARGWPCLRHGLRHGTITLCLPGAEGAMTQIEVTTFREEGAYHDGRHPDTVRFGVSLEADLRRRDFTVNALAWSPRRGVVDPYGGQQDLRQGLLRAVGDASRRFHEDGLRLLRALRLAAEHDFRLESDTAAAWWAMRPRLALVAAERQRPELDRLLMAPALDRWTHALLALLRPLEPSAAQAYPSIATLPLDLPLRWLGLALALDGQTAPEALLGSLAPYRPSRGFIHACQARLLPLEGSDRLSLCRWLSTEDGYAYWPLRLAWATHIGAIQDPKPVRTCIEALVAECLPRTLSELALDGQTLCQAKGRPPGPWVGKTLTEALEAVWLGHCPNERTALLAHCP